MLISGSKILVTGASGFIGANMVEMLSFRGAHVLNFDLNPPLKKDQNVFWRRGDIMEREGLLRVMLEFAPHIVIHLAARTDCDENTTVESGYTVNVAGTENVLVASRDAGSVRHVIVASTQYVCQPGCFPQNDEDFRPHTVYGQSKAIMEKLVRSFNSAVPWTIVRPANVWGPWHMRYRREIWNVIRRGLYLHPGRKPVVRTYGYVKNVAEQIGRIIEAPTSVTAGKVFYLGDLPIDVYDWVNAFSLHLTGRPVRVVPRCFVRAIAACGDILVRCGIKFPLTSSRYRSMTEDYIVPTDRTLSIFGPCPFSLEGGVAETVNWLRTCERGSAA